MDTLNLNVLLAVMTDAELKAKRDAMPDNEALVEAVNGVITQRASEAEALKVKQAFEVKVAALAKLPAPPEGIHNVMMKWAEVELPTGEAEEVMIDGKPTMRQPTLLQWAWVTEVNFAVHVGVKRVGEAVSGKREVKVWKVNAATKQVEDMGTFTTATEACKALNLTVAGDSANRVLTRNGYLPQPTTV